MKSPLTFSFGILVAAMLVAQPALADLDVVTTTTDLADIVRAIGGDHVDVESICQGSQDPHYVQARPSYMVTVSGADLLVAVGLELEVGWLPDLIQGARNPDVNPGSLGYFEAASAIEPIDIPTGSVDRSEGDLHPYGNPHFWLDPVNTQLAAAAIADRMGELDPDNATTYDANLETFNTQIDEAMARWSEAMAPYAGTQVASYHRTFNYFFERYELEPIGYIEERPGIPPAPSHLARLIRQMQADDVLVIFHENYYDVSESEMVAQRTDAEVIVLPVSVGGVEGTSSYEELLDSIIDSFVATMSEQ